MLVILSLDVNASVGIMGQVDEKPRLVYRVVELDGYEDGGNEIWVVKDGNLQNTGIEAYDIYEIIDQRDYDGDGFEEAFVYQSTFGSGEIPPFILYFDKDTRTFRKVEFVNLGVFLNNSVELWNGRWSFKGGTPSHYERYIYENRRIVKVEDYTRPLPDGAEILLIADSDKMFDVLEAEDGEKKNISFDLDGDGQNETIECEYLHGVKWEDFERQYKTTMNITIYWSNGQKTDLTYDETWLKLIILSTKTNGKNDLANGKKGEIFKWDGNTYKLQ